MNGITSTSSGKQELLTDAIDLIDGNPPSIDPSVRLDPKDFRFDLSFDEESNSAEQNRPKPPGGL